MTAKRNSMFNPTKYNHQFATLGGHRYHYVDEGDKNGVPVLLIHGFPDLWYGWRYQIEYLTKLGFRVLVPDMLGYGQTDKPVSKDRTKAHPSYSPKSLASHMVELMDQLGLEKAVLVGHDWGAAAVSRFGWHFPERAIATISVGNPFQPIAKVAKTASDFMKENPSFEYFEIFGTEEAIDGLNNQDKEYYLEYFKAFGYEGPLSYYKCFEQSFREDQHLFGQRYTIPTLLIIVRGDVLLTPEYCRTLPVDYYDSFTTQEVDGPHWVLTQNPVAVNNTIGSYLKRILTRSTVSTIRDTARNKTRVLRSKL
ncbi:hypothetical protein BGW38_001605 [Lunasporangiospora selenospora]|uniref:AB hydrolase-1 domain-containing protein n=1 Tax=Lunasporangiospora selenospora TaxID=979761 RepID=A0A9P6KE60_9FUNG|nr:hypothetical protein BGW38_001605 [Lunasporangiospora selenospora]